MKAVRIPGWLGSAVLDRYHSGASHLFLLHGNIRDVHPFGPDYVGISDGVRRLADARAVVVSYDVGGGLSFPDAAREKAFRKALGLKAGPLPADPARALILLDALLSTDRCPTGSVAIVIDYAHTLAPADGGAPERQSITTLARWASDPAIATRRPFIVLTAPAAGDVSSEVYAGASGAEVVTVPRPALEDRVEFARELQRRWPEVAWEMPPEQLGAETGGLSLVQIEDMVQRARGARTPLARGSILERKIDLLRQEYGDVLEILEPRHDLSAVGGLDHAVGELREIEIGRASCRERVSYSV